MPITPRTHNSATIKNQMADVHSPADGLADGLETVCVCVGGESACLRAASPRIIGV